MKKRLLKKQQKEIRERILYINKHAPEVLIRIKEAEDRINQAILQKMRELNEDTNTERIESTERP